jgi:hypothetical protein
MLCGVISVDQRWDVEGARVAVVAGGIEGGGLLEE